MDAQFNQWRLAVDRIGSAGEIDWREAARLAAEIASGIDDGTLRQAASQALPILRSAAQGGVDRTTTDAARRRLGVLRDTLHALTTPRFGRRGIVAKPLTQDECHRQMLGLPLDRRLAGAEIHRAYKRVAKTVHPDAGGNAQAFLDLTAARDALMKAR
jgi:hypothetical protein